MILNTYDMVRITSAHKNAGGFAPETDCAGRENGVVNIEVWGGVGEGDLGDLCEMFEEVG